MSSFRTVLFAFALAAILATPAHAETLAGVNAQIDAQAPGALAVASTFAKANVGNANAWVALARRAPLLRR